MRRPSGCARGWNRTFGGGVPSIRWRSLARSCSSAAPRWRWPGAASKKPAAAVARCSAAPDRLGRGEGGSSRWTRATATSTPSCSPPTRSRCATRSTATGAGSTRARTSTCTSTRRRPRRRSAPTPPAIWARTRPSFAFVDSTTMGLALVYRGLVQPGDEVLTTEHDHYATHESLRLAGARIRKVRLYDDPAAGERGDDDLGDQVRGDGEDEGRRGYVGALGDRREAADREAPPPLWAANRPLLVVDGVHALGVEPDPLGHHLLRRLRGRHPQVARRTARHGPHLVDQGVGADDPGHPVVRDGRLRRVDERDLRRRPCPRTRGRCSHRAATTRSSTAGRLAEAFDWQATLGRAGGRGPDPRARGPAEGRAWRGSTA